MLLRIALCLVLLSLSAAAQAPPPRTVILITIDGLRGDYLGAADRYHLKTPTLRALIARGASSEHTVSVFPTLTGTAHTTLVTGVSAGRHGIIGNNMFAPDTWEWTRDNYDFQPAYRDYSQVKVGSLWSAARAMGLKTAAINWPQTAGGPIDYRVDVAVAESGAASHERTLHSASAGWFDKVSQRIGPVSALDARMADHWKALIASEIVRTLAPSLLAVHFSLTDAEQHAHGPGTPEALSALEDTDRNIALVVEAVHAAGLDQSTIIIVTGDHGFLELHTELAINLPLVEAGLIHKGSDGKVQWQAIVAPNRGLGSLYVRDGAAGDTESRARAALDAYAVKYPGRFRLLTRQTLDQYGADRGARFGIEPLPGYVLDARLSGPFAQTHTRAAGHGYRPDLPDMQTGLIIAGAGAYAGRHLPETRTIDVAPTIAHLLGVVLPDAEGTPIVGAFTRSDR